MSCLAVAVRDPVALIDKIQMGVDLQDVDIALIIIRIDAGDVDGMITANGNGQGTRGQNSEHTCFNIGVAARGVRVDDIGVANIDDAYVRAQIGGDIGVDLASILDIGFLGEGRDADKRQVQPPAFISVCAHNCAPLLWFGAEWDEDEVFSKQGIVDALLYDNTVLDIKDILPADYLWYMAK